MSRRFTKNYKNATFVTVVEIMDDFIPTCRQDGDIIVGSRRREKENYPL